MPQGLFHLQYVKGILSRPQEAAKLSRDITPPPPRVTDCTLEPPAAKVCPFSFPFARALRNGVRGDFRRRSR